jgi:hypothetical protein
VTEPDDIRQQMARIRHDLHKDVSGVRGGVAQAMDWRSLPRNYPLASICAALAVGYAVVPRRVSSPEETVSTQPDAQSAEPDKRRRGVGSHAIGLLWPIAEQAIQAYAALWLEKWIRGRVGRGPDSFGGRPEDRKGPRSANGLVFTAPGEPH